MAAVLAAPSGWRHRSGSYHPSMETTAPITSERDLPLPVRVEPRALADELIEGRLRPAERDRLVDELLVALEYRSPRPRPRAVAGSAPRSLPDANGREVQFVRTSPKASREAGT